MIQGNLNVIGEANGLMTFDSVGLQVNGVTFIDNENDPGTIRRVPAPPDDRHCGPVPSGDGVTNITNSTFEGLASTYKVTMPALTIDNGYGFNTTFIQGSNPAPADQTFFPVSAPTWTQIGFTVGVTIRTHEGALAGRFGDQQRHARGRHQRRQRQHRHIDRRRQHEPSSPVVYGSVAITNNNAQPMQSNQVNFVTTIVYGEVFVNNVGGGATRTSVQHSILGEQLQDNGPVEVVNTGVGQNQYLMTGSELPWGLAIDNPSPSFGNSTIIDSSYIGQTANGAHPQAQRELRRHPVEQFVGHLRSAVGRRALRCRQRRRRRRTGHVRAPQQQRGQRRSRPAIGTPATRTWPWTVPGCPASR